MAEYHGKHGKMYHVSKGNGNRFVLTVLDLCTQNPEAIPFKQHTAQDVAKAC